jgi:hypothetical protein
MGQIYFIKNAIKMGQIYFNKKGGRFTPPLFLFPLLVLPCALEQLYNLTPNTTKRGQVH